MNKFQRRLWVTGVGFCASLIILAGLFVGAFRLAVQLVPEYRADVASRVALLIGSPVEIEHIDLIWRGRYPTLQLRGVDVGGDPENRLGLDELSVGFAITRLLRGDFTPAQIGLSGTRLQLIREDGQFRLGGIKAQDQGDSQSPQDFLNQLQRVSRVQWRNAHLLWVDKDAQQAPRNIVIDSLDTRRQFGGMNVQAQLHLEDMQQTRLQVDASLLSNPWQIERLQVEVENWSAWTELQAYIPNMPALAGELTHLELDSHWQAGEWENAQVQLEFKDMRPAVAAAGVKLLSASAYLDRFSDTGIRASVQLNQLQTAQSAWPAQNLLLSWQPEQSIQSAQYSLSMEYVRLDDLQPWLDLLPEEHAQKIRILRPRGELREFVVQSAGAVLLPQLTGEFRSLSVDPYEQLPGVSNLSGLLTFTHAGGRLQLESEALSVDAPKVFSQVLHLDELKGAISWQRGPDGWQLDAPGLHYAGMNLDGVGRLQLQLGEQVEMDLNLNFFCSDPRALLAYQPLIWPDSLKDWLAGAVQKAQVASGQVRINGPLAQFPFRDRKGGEFLVDLELQDIELKFAPDWPQVEVSEARLVIDGMNLTVDAGAAEIGGMQARSATAEIPDLEKAELFIDAKVSGNAKNVWSMLSASELRKDLSELFQTVDVSGPVTGRLRLELPLNNLKNTRYSVDATLDKAALWTSYWPDPVQKIRGDIHIDETGLRGRAVRAVVAGMPMQLDLTPELGKTHIGASFSTSADKLPKSVPVPDWIKRRATGAADFRLELEVGKGAHKDLVVHSSLLGMDLDMPAPFSKKADQLRPLDVRISPGKNSRVHVTYGELLGLDMLLEGKKATLAAGRLRLGGDVAAAGAPGWWVEGSLAQADLDAWLPLIQDLAAEVATYSKPSAQSATFGGLVLRLGRLDAFGQRLPDSRIQLTQNATQWQLGLTGPRANGSMQLSNPQGSERLRIIGEFENMNWTRAIEVVAGEALDPNVIPELDLTVKNFALNDIALGQLQLNLEPVNDGLRIAQATVDSPQRRELDLSGLWLRDPKGSSAAFDFSMDTESFSSWLTVLGYQDNLVAQRGQLNGQLNWDSDPNGLVFSKLNGQLEFDFRDGQLLNIEPGAGRVLGLFSVNALPRRFFLDFSDVVNTGLGFDQLNGRFDLLQGIATTENLQVKGPSLRIGVRGQVDLVKREYDQIVTIYPGISSGVSLAATVLGGPVLGLVALLAQELLDQPLDQVSQIGYHLGGSWDNPQVSRLQ